MSLAISGRFPEKNIRIGITALSVTAVITLMVNITIGSGGIDIDFWTPSLWMEMPILLFSFILSLASAALPLFGMQWNSTFGKKLCSVLPPILYLINSVLATIHNMLMYYGGGAYGLDSMLSYYGGGAYGADGMLSFVSDFFDFFPWSSSRLIMYAICLGVILFTIIQTNDYSTVPLFAAGGLALIGLATMLVGVSPYVSSYIPYGSSYITNTYYVTNYLHDACIWVASSLLAASAISSSHHKKESNSPDVSPAETVESPLLAPAKSPSVTAASQQIKELQELLDMGAITQNEFDEMKKELLGL